MGKKAALLLTGLAVVALAGCGWAPDRQLRDERTVETAVKAVTIEGGAGSVKITGSPDATTHVKRHVRYRRDKPAATDRVDGDTLILRTNCGQACWVDYEVTVPSGVRVAGRNSSGDVVLSGVSTASVSLSSGDLTIRGASGDVNARASSGEITISDVQGSVAAEASSGNVQLTGVRGTVSVRATSGDISGQDLRGGHTTARTSSGEISLVLAAAQDVDVEATSGDVRVLTAAGQHYRIDTSTSSGDVRAKVTSDPAADHHLKVKTSSGDITVEPR